VGEEVTFSCSVDVEACGKYLAAQFYHGSSRVYMYSPLIGINSPAGALVDRCFDVTQAHLGQDCLRGKLEISEENLDLTISPIFDEDDGDYSCKISYYKTSEDCPSTHYSNLRIIAPPSSTRIYTSEDPDQDLTDQDVGPLLLGSQLELACEAVGSKPGAQIIWFWESEPDEILGGETETVKEQDGTFTTTNLLTMDIEESLSGRKLQCRIEHEALSEAIVKSLGNILINVAVSSVDLLDESLVGTEDEEMTIVCVAEESRPEASISWKIEGISDDAYSQEFEIIELGNGLFQTKSQITVTPTADLNMGNISCEAINEIMSEPIVTTGIFNIQYSPRTIVTPVNVTAIASEAVELSCLIDANPLNISEIEWRRNEELVFVDLSFNISEYTASEESDMDDAMSEEVALTTLTFESIERDDEGRYTCHAKNEIGETVSYAAASIDVLYPPSTLLEISENIVNEENLSNTTLSCSIVDGDPLELTKVSWFLDGALQKVCTDNKEGTPLPDEYLITEGELEEEGMGEYISCSEDHLSEVIILMTDRTFLGNWSCVGENMAGTGEPSQPQFLEILYVPGEAKIETDNNSPDKYDNITLLCSVDDAGNPEEISFVWERNGVEVDDAVESMLYIENLGVEDRGNYSCRAKNRIGLGEPALYILQINAPPTFLLELNENYQFLDSQPEDLECIVECVMDGDSLCDVEWLVDGEMVTNEDEEYDIQEDMIPANLEENAFESVHSKFSWNLENIPDKHLPHDPLNFTVSCKTNFDQENVESISEIESTSVIFVEYPPQLVETSETNLVVNEGDEGTSLLCSSSANPNPVISWYFKNEVISEAETLYFGEIFERSQSGQYVCKSENKHGQMEAFVEVDVHFVPQCSLTYEIDSSENTLIMTCTAEANPQDVEFVWMRDESMRLEGQSDQDTPLISEIRLNLGNETHGNYSCQVSNKVGEADPCVLTIPENFMEKLKQEWRLEDYTTLIIIAAIVGFFVLLCFASLIYNLRRNRRSKVQWYNVREHSEVRETDLSKDKLRGSVDLDIILEESEYEDISIRSYE